MIFPALYNGPLNYFARLVRLQEVVLEQYDNYSKQTYRNRCLILGPNGVIALSIPVSKVHGVKTHLRDIRIDNGSNWNRIHWRGLVAAYASSPYFEYLSEEISPFYHKRFEFLLDLNRQLIETILDFMGLDIRVRYSEEFAPIRSEKDIRHFIHPKKDLAAADPDFLHREYQQVFSDRLGFRPNLSILDLIFNMGPDSLTYLRSCLRT